MEKITINIVLEKIRKMRCLISLVIGLLSLTVQAQYAGIPASDTLGADDFAGNPSFIGGIANGGSTSHGVW